VCDRPPRTRRLRFREAESCGHPLQGALDLDGATGPVNVAPSERKQLALASATGERDRIQRSYTVALGVWSTRPACASSTVLAGSVGAHAKKPRRSVTGGFSLRHTNFQPTTAAHTTAGHALMTASAGTRAEVPPQMPLGPRAATKSQPLDPPSTGEATTFATRCSTTGAGRG
jgi:hypothetical protein